MSITPVSAILPTYNCETTLDRVFQCLFAVKHEALEVIVVDDASTDGTRDICARYPVRLIALPENRGPAYCRNLAIRESAGEVILFLDSDIAFAPELIDAMRAFLETRPEFAGIFTLTAPDPLNPGFAARYFALQEYLRYRDVVERSRRSWSFISTRCGLLRREVFDETGGFNESFALPSYEDLEFSSRMDDRHQLAMELNFMVLHYWPDSVWKIMRRLHINARGVMNFSPAMRRKASVPFVRDRNARLLLGVSWLLFLASPLWWPLIGVALLTHGVALHQTRWLFKGCLRLEGVLFTARAYATYTLTLFPFSTGVAMGLMDSALRIVHGNQP